MSDAFKVSGKRAQVPAADPAWRFTLRPGGWIVAEHASTGERRRIMLSEGRARSGGGTQLSASVGGILWHGEWNRASRAGGAASAGGDADLVAQFPGKVRKVLVKAGDAVQEGDPLVLVEAMKMEFAVKAPYTGVVEQVLVAEGQQLSPGTRFVSLKAGASS